MKFNLVLLLFIIVLNASDRLEAMAVKRMRRAIVGHRWPKKKIAYDISNKDFSESSATIIKNALKEFERALIVDTNEKCLEFVEQKNQRDEDFISIVSGVECSSYIGYFQKRNDLHRITLGDGCLTSGTIQHELMHRYHCLFIFILLFSIITLFLNHFQLNK